MAAPSSVKLSEAFLLPSVFDVQSAWLFPLRRTRLPSPCICRYTPVLVPADQITEEPFNSCKSPLRAVPNRYLPLGEQINWPARRLIFPATCLTQDPVIRFSPEGSIVTTFAFFVLAIFTVPALLTFTKTPAILDCRLRVASRALVAGVVVAKCSYSLIMDFITRA